MDNFRDSYFKVSWDLTTNPLQGIYWGKQYDTGRGFVVTVINGDQVVTATNEVLRLKWEKPDNTTGYVNATIVNGKFIIENIDQMFTVQGSVRADFELSVGGKFVASTTFHVNVEKAVAVDSIESSSDFTALQDALADVGDIVKQEDLVDFAKTADHYTKAEIDTTVGNLATKADVDDMQAQVDTVGSEVILARGTESTLGARLDSTDAQLNNMTQDFTQHKLDYVAHKEDYATLVDEVTELSYITQRYTVDSWQKVQDIVKAGLGSKAFRIGDSFLTTVDGQNHIVDVIGIDHDAPNSITIQFRNCIMNAQFDAPEALYYAQEELPAGTYNLTYNSVTYQFTLTQPVPTGGQITFPWAYNTDILTTKVSTYESQASTVAIERVDIAVGSEGTELTPINDMNRCRYGSNNYLESNIRQWLNSGESSFTWVPKTNFDRPSTGSPYSGAGFLNLLDPELASVIVAVDKQVARNTVTDDGGQDLFSDKVFLLSRTEIYGGTEGDVTGEEPYPYYSALASSPSSGELAGRIKLLNGSPRYWWLRSPGVGGSYGTRGVHSSGNVGSNSAYYANGLSPACVII